ncbi:MAG TPA: methyltransferase domain-containing protein [Ramlibacter sp.]|nr:methyltransferase domain-containing protein [Ramlibacter sp.]
MWRPDDPQGNEAAKVRFDIVPYTRGAVLDLGCGPHKAFPHFIGVDNCKDVELFGIKMRPDLVIPDCADLAPHVIKGSLDAIFSSHLLEHIEDAAGALASWWSVIGVGGHLVLYLPHRDLYPRIGTPGANPDHKHDFHPDDIVALMRRVGGWDLLVNETRDAGTEYSFLQVYRKRADAQQVLVYKHPKPGAGRRCCVVRYGGFGDQLQASAILPELKRQGWHITFMTTPKGQDILRNDPHIDDWLVQDTDQVLNQDLWEYWEVWRAKFDKWVNLSSSVEDALLAAPGSPEHAWPQAVRQKYLNRNYAEFTAELAEVPFKPDGRFYPSPEERAKATALLRSDDPQRAAFNVLWVLSGSSIHKFYPGQDVVISRALKELPGIRFILSGDEACKILEVGWEENPQVLCTSGEMGIRDTLALAQQVDVVMGPETGVLNAVAYEEHVAKVILLSHSSHENLTKHWAKTAVLEGQAKCYPCHQLHHTTRYCPTDAESGAAACQVGISPDDVFSALKWQYALWTTRKEGIPA